MTNPYGPWATAIDAGRNLQLSSFWRQRLTMLVPASRTSPVLSRRNLLGLVAAAALVCALPVFLAAPAVAEQEKTSQKQSDGAKMDPGGKESAASVSKEAGGKEQEQPVEEVAADLKTLQGPWKVVRVEKGKDADSFWAGVIGDGQKIDLSAIDRLNFVAGNSGHSFNFLSIEEAVNCGLLYRIDPRAATKTIDLSYFGSHRQFVNGRVLEGEPGGTVALGIYEMDGDRLKICLARFRPAKTEQRRPKRFAVEPDSADALFLLERYRPPKDEKAIYGKWAIVKQLEDGNPSPKRRDRPITCWFSDENAFSLVTGHDGYVLAGRWMLDTAKQPKRITIFARSEFAGPSLTFGPPPPPERFPGIYKLDGNGLQIAYRKGGPPPEKFESVAGSGVTLLVMRRIEPPKPVHSSNAAETQGEKTKPAETITKPASPKATDQSGKTSATKPADGVSFTSD